MLTKETFVFAIESIEKQYIKDKQVATLLSKAFPESSSANLMPDNHYLSNALLLVLQEQMEGINKEQSEAINKGNYKNGHSWIEWFCFETKFGKESKRLKAYDKDKNVIPMSNASELYDFLVKEKREKENNDWENLWTEFLNSCKEANKTEIGSKDFFYWLDFEFNIPERLK